MASTIQQLLLSGHLNVNPAFGAAGRAQTEQAAIRGSEASTERTQQVIDLAPAAAARDEERLLIAQQGAQNAQVANQIKVKEFLRKQNVADLEEGITTAKQFDAIQDQPGLDAFIALNPVDGKDLQGVQFGDDRFLGQKQQSQLLIAGATEIQQEKALTTVGKIQADLDAGRITLEQANAAAAKATAIPKGSQLIIGADGTVSFTQGGVEGDQIIPGTATTNKIDQAIIDGQATLQGLDVLAGQFKPEFLQVGTRLSAEFSDLKEKFGFDDLTAQEKRDLTEFSSFKRNSVSQINAALKARSGLAVTVAEEDRIRGELPNPGKGLFDGDGPTVFQAKMVGAIADIKRSQARLVFARRNGLDFSSIPLANIDAIINGRSQELVNGGMTQEQADEVLRQEFGL